MGTEDEIEEGRRRAQEKATNPDPPPSGDSSASGYASAAAITSVASRVGDDFARSRDVESLGRAPASLSQAVLLLRRRLAELDHERACYVEALGALGNVDPVAASSTVGASRPAMPAAAAVPGPLDSS